MGLIRKTLMISTAGVVRGSSKKQRVAKKSLNELKEQTRIMTEQVNRQRIEQERDVRIKAHATHIPAPEGSHEERMAALQRIRDAANGVAAPPVRPAIAAVPALPVAGWYPDADREHLLRFWDGADWTEKTAPRA